MKQPTALGLGADARTIPRKKGLLAEYFYEGEPVAVTSPVDCSLRSVGVVLSLTGDHQINAGVMRIGIGQGREVNVQYTDVPNNVSKLLGFYCISDSGESEAKDSALRPSGAVLEYQTSQQSLSINAEPVHLNRINVGRKHVLGAGVPDGGFTPIIEQGVSVTTQLSRRDSELGELQQLIGQEISRSIQPEIEKISHAMSMVNDRMTAEIRAMYAKHNRMDADIDHQSQINGKPQTGVDSTSTSLSENEQAMVEFTQAQFETALASCNHEIQVTSRLLKMLKQMNQLDLDPSNITDHPSSTSRSDVSRPENMPPILSDNKTDEELDSFLEDQAASEWSLRDIENLAKLFLNVCLGEMNSEIQKNYVDELLSNAQVHDVRLLSSVFASWLQKHISTRRNSQVIQPARQSSLLRKLFSKVLTSKSVLGAQRNDVENLDACDKNGMQVALISKPLTIWNAVGSFESPEGKTCWHVVRIVLKFLIKHRLECPWMNGYELGVFGETPLHIALLFNNAEETDWRFHEMFNDLWKMCPRLHDAQYQDALYEGENVLHLAIIRNFGNKVIDQILSSDRKKTILMQQAVGSFFKKPSLSYGYCNLLGEYPLFFAACSHQIEIFQHLVAHGADLERTASEKNYNLMHLLILNDSSIRRRSETPSTETDRRSCKLLEHYKKLAGYLKKMGKLTTLEQSCNSEGYTPLKLAAAKGSVPMFLHMFDDEKIKKAWSYGALVCKKLYLDGVDVPLNRQDTPLSDSSRADMSLLEILVLKKRKDILSESEIDKLVQMKWDKYGCFIFHRKLGVTLFVTVAIFLLPMTKIETSLTWKTLHIFSHTVVAFVFEHLCEKRSSDSLVHRFIFRTWSRADLTVSNLIIRLIRDVVGWIFQPILPVTNQIEAWAEQAESLLRFLLEPDGPDGSDGRGTWFSVYGACSRALHICDRMLALCWQWHEDLLDWDAEKRAAQFVPLFSRVLLGLYVLRVCLDQSCSKVADDSTQGTASPTPSSFYGALNAVLGYLTSIEALLYSVIGLVSFSSVASLAMVFRDCGSLVLLVSKAVSSELPVFIAVYAIFLLCFAHAHFLASNHLHAGLAEGADSVWRIFSAMLGNFSAEKEELVQQPWNHFLVSSITVTNYFLVAVVSIPPSTISRI
jgi:hypothetical protein